MDFQVWLGIGTLSTATAGLMLVTWQLREQRRALRAEFGNLYIQRYWEIDDRLMFETKGSKEHRQNRHRYLRLFEDEFDVAKMGFLEIAQWRAWHSVLDDSHVLARVKGDLMTCNPRRDMFVRLRACIAQREEDQGPHGARACDGLQSP